jgi:hypothetical protein
MSTKEQNGAYGWCVCVCVCVCSSSTSFPYSRLLVVQAMLCKECRLPPCGSALLERLDLRFALVFVGICSFPFLKVLFFLPLDEDGGGWLLGLWRSSMNMSRDLDSRSQVDHASSINASSPASLHSLDCVVNLLTPATRPAHRLSAGVRKV